MDKTLTEKIIKSEYKPAYSKDLVRIYTYNDKKYFVRRYRYKNLVNQALFNRLFSFELLRYMNINIPNLYVSLEDTGGENKELCLFSEDCGGKPIGGIDVDNGSIDKKYHRDISRMVYVADLFNFSDIAKDNIFVVDNDKLVLIDFDCPGVNFNFPPVNVFEESYSIANSFDLHTTKGNSQLICKIALAEKPSSNLEISKNDRIEIEERFFSIDKTFLKQLSHVVKEKYFRNWEELNFNEEFIEGYIENILSRIENLKNCKSHDYSEFDEPSEEYKTLRRSVPKLYYDDELTNTQEFDSKEDISITESDGWQKIELDSVPIEKLDVSEDGSLSYVDYLKSRAIAKKSSECDRSQ